MAAKDVVFGGDARARLVEELRQLYVLAARARGARSQRVLIPLIVVTTCRTTSPPFTATSDAPTAS